MATCKYCGGKVLASDRRCFGCGAPVDIEESVLQREAWNPTNWYGGGGFAGTAIPGYTIGGGEAYQGVRVYGGGNDEDIDDDEEEDTPHLQSKIFDLEAQLEKDRRAITFILIFIITGLIGWFIAWLTGIL